MKSWILSAVKDNKGFLLFLILMFVFRSAVADWNEVPTGSMKPTILEGDRILVNKMAYDLRVPFTHVSLLRFGNPKRGDIIVFDSEFSNRRLVKRTIGVPGDIVSMQDNVLFINGEEIAYDFVAATRETIDKTEHLLGVDHPVRLQRQGSRLSSFLPIEVPEGFYLALGDNRDNSGDSRVIGFVPRKEIVGRSRSVVLSFNYDNYYIPRSGRFFQIL